MSDRFRLALAEGPGDVDLLIAEGKLPNFARLKEKGAHALCRFSPDAESLKQRPAARGQRRL
jgi:hypothetical protein